MVEAEGTIDLGPPYGSVHVVGKTKDEICAALNKWLHKVAPRSGRLRATGPRLRGPAGNRPVPGRSGRNGQSAACMDGCACRARRLPRPASQSRNNLPRILDSPELSVDVVAYNSKVYYIITQGAGLGDNVRRLPVTGNETVLDAISQINGLSQVSSKNIWIARPSAADPEKANDLARRLGRHYGPRGDGHQLPDLPRRSDLHRRGPAGHPEQFACRRRRPPSSGPWVSSA